MTTLCRNKKKKINKIKEKKKRKKGTRRPCLRGIVMLHTLEVSVYVSIAWNFSSKTSNE